MSELKTYMMVHKNPGVNCEDVQANWRKLAQVESCKWIKTYYNEELGTRFCVWEAYSEEELKNIFTELGISWESVTQVLETTPDMWGEKWADHLKEDSIADNLGN